ncbi:MAG: hypothetical protein ACXVV5_26875 [Solirubrobacteraceae bacterium]
MCRAKASPSPSSGKTGQNEPPPASAQTITALVPRIAEAVACTASWRRRPTGSAQVQRIPAWSASASASPNQTHIGQK